MSDDIAAPAAVTIDELFALLTATISYLGLADPNAPSIITTLAEQIHLALRGNSDER